MENTGVDYHLHTYYSDGKYSPTEVVKWAKKNELHTIAITDHDGVDGIFEAQIAGEALDITVIPGIELSSVMENGKGLHILGYNIDIKNEELIEVCQATIKSREERNEKFLQALGEEGYPLELKDLTFREGQSFIGKPIFARALVDKGYVSTMEEAFDGILNSKKLRAIKKDKISTKKAIEIIKGAKGIPVLAHPALVRGIGERDTEEFYANLDKILSELKKMGLSGLECYYPKHSHDETLRFVDLAEKYHLHITTGSDYHGYEKP